MTLADDLPRDYHDRDLEEYRSPVGVTAPAHLRGQAVVLQDIAEERLRQLEKWGPQAHPDGTGLSINLGGTMVITDRIRDYMRRLCDFKAEQGQGTWLDILLEEVFEAAAEMDVQSLRKELVQVAAVATSWVEDIDKRG